ncbi:MAG: glycosyltransferase [Planctomycetaceae bacterium]|nr:glycosyltransferase [Planctomycetaceae bacterium]
MTPIRLALCITDLDIGGAERHLTQLAVRVDRRRFSPVVYCLGPKPPRDEASCVPALLAAGVEVHCLNARAIWQFPVVVHRLRRLFDAQNPQVVQTFLFHANVLGRIAACCAGVKTILAGVRVAERSARWHLWLDRMTHRCVDRYVCVSQSVADFSSQYAGLPAEKLVVIPNGIDLGKYPAGDCPDFLKATREMLGIPPGRRAITFVGRLTPQKGVDWLVETAPQWMAQLPDCDLLLVGDGPLRDSLEAAASSAGIANRVHFAGWRPDVPQILAASSLMVLPSAWEGMPNVVLEAMASRLPVLATDVEGVLELLGPNAPPQTVRYRDTQMLTQRLVALMSDPSGAAAIGAENRRRAEQHFAISRTVAAYEDLWASLVRQQAGCAD